MTKPMSARRLDSLWKMAQARESPAEQASARRILREHGINPDIRPGSTPAPSHASSVKEKEWMDIIKQSFRAVPVGQWNEYYQSLLVHPKLSRDPLFMSALHKVATWANAEVARHNAEVERLNAETARLNAATARVRAQRAASKRAWDEARARDIKARNEYVGWVLFIMALSFALIYGLSGFGS